MAIETKQEKIWRRFLLGDVTMAERAAVEDEFLADEENFVRLEILESELIEDYLHGDLTDPDKALFESEFLRTAERRERVARMKILIDEATVRKLAVVTSPGKISFGERLAAFFKNPLRQMVFAASVLILLAAFGAWFFNRQSISQPEIVKTKSPITPTPAPLFSPEIIAPQNSNLANENKSNHAPKPSPTVAPERTPPPNERETALLIFILNPGGIRGGAAGNRLRVQPQTREIRLQLNLESNNYSSYTARVTTVDGATIYTSPILKSNRKSLLLQLPIRKLQPGDYIVELSGVNAAGQSESVDDYAFTLQK